MTFALIIIVFGCVALAVKLGLISGSIWGFAWPIILIVMGVSLLRRRRRWGGHWGPWSCGWGSEGEKDQRPRK